MGYFGNEFFFRDPELNVILMHPEAGFSLSFSGWSNEGKCDFLYARHCAEGFKRHEDEGRRQLDKALPCPSL